MHKGLLYIPMIVVGLAGMIWGLPASFRLAGPRNVAACLAVLAGLILTLLGVLLAVIPNFFR